MSRSPGPRRGTATSLIESTPGASRDSACIVSGTRGSAKVLPGGLWFTRARAPMPTVNVSVWINAPVERVYAIAKDNATFPEYMKDVQSITKVEEEGNRVVSDWVGIISTFGIKIRWRQEDIWD